MSQLDLALEAEISTRHLSFVETGRAQPSREMLLHLAQALDIPLRERNALLVAAGFAPRFEARAFDAPDMSVAREAVQRVLDGHEPYPALAVDRHWTLLAANRAVMPLLAGVDPSLLSGAVNVLRLSLHPDGLAPRIANLVAHERGSAVVLQHDHGIRHPGGCNARRDGARSVLPGRRSDRPDHARDGVVMSGRGPVLVLRLRGCSGTRKPVQKKKKP